MRISSSSTLCLTAALLGRLADAQLEPHTSATTTTATTATAVPHVEFVGIETDSQGRAVFNVHGAHSSSGYQGSEQFNFILQAGVSITSVEWLGSNDNVNETITQIVLSSDSGALNSMGASASTPTGRSVAALRGLAGSRYAAILGSRNPPAISLNPSSGSASGTITLSGDGSGSDNPFVTFLNQLQWLNFSWTTNTGGKGSTTSRYFTFSLGTVLPDDVSAALQRGDPAAPELVLQADGGAVPSQQGGASPSATTASSSATGGNQIPAASSSSGSASASASSSSLSKGAIAGIAVGCGLAALLALGALVWCLLARRRRDRAGATPVPNGYDNRTQELIAQKEANAGVSDTVPHSPYSDDGHGSAGGAVRDAAFAGGALSGAHHLHHHQQQQQHLTGGDAGSSASPYSPYLDHPRDATLVGDDSSRYSHPRSGGVGGDAASGARSATPQTSARYAHLVEEGMTEAEIRRMEEEERHLDAAIEEAGHH